jgi:hypothetical protein
LGGVLLFSLSLSFNRLLDRAKKIRRGGTPEDKQELQQQMDKLMDRVVHEQLTAEDILRTETAHLQGKHSRNHWSSWMGNKMRTIRLLLQLIKCARIRKHRTKVRTILDEIKRHTNCTYVTDTTINDFPHQDAPRHMWTKWTHEVEMDLKRLQTTLNARARVKQRKAMKDSISEHERRTAMQKSLKKFLNYSPRRNQREPRPLTLMVTKPPVPPSSIGAVEVIDGIPR